MPIETMGATFPPTAGMVEVGVTGDGVKTIFEILQSTEFGLAVQGSSEPQFGNEIWGSVPANSEVVSFYVFAVNNGT